MGFDLNTRQLAAFTHVWRGRWSRAGMGQLPVSTCHLASGIKFTRQGLGTLLKQSNMPQKKMTLV